MSGVSIEVHPNTVAISEIGGQSLSGLVHLFGDLGNASYEPNPSIIVLRENELAGTGAEFWETVEVIIVGAVSGASEAIFTQTVAEVKDRFTSYFECNLREHPRNHQAGFPWVFRRVSIKLKASYTTSDAQKEEYETSVELSSERHSSDDS